MLHYNKTFKKSGEHINNTSHHCLVVLLNKNVLFSTDFFDKCYNNSSCRTTDTCRYHTTSRDSPEVYVIAGQDRHGRWTQMCHNKRKSSSSRPVTAPLVLFPYPAYLRCWSSVDINQISSPRTTSSVIASSLHLRPVLSTRAAAGRRPTIGHPASIKKLLASKTYMTLFNIYNNNA